MNKKKTILAHRAYQQQYSKTMYRSSFYINIKYTWDVGVN